METSIGSSDMKFENFTIFFTFNCDRILSKHFKSLSNANFLSFCNLCALWYVLSGQGTHNSSCPKKFYVENWYTYVCLGHKKNVPFLE